MVPESRFDESRLVAEVCAALTAHQLVNNFPAIDDLVAGFFDQISPDDATLHDAADWAKLLADLLDFASTRQPNAPLIRLLSPSNDKQQSDLLQIVTDDMPFLVESVLMAVRHHHLDVRAVIHPVLPLVRDNNGQLQTLDADSGNAESIMHIELAPLDDEKSQQVLLETVNRSLREVRSAVTDWQPMRQAMLKVADDLPTRQLNLSNTALSEAREFLAWAADDHFIFLGYREYRVCGAAGEEQLQVIEESGLGILRNTAHSNTPRSLEPMVAPKLHQSGTTHAIIITKTNAPARVHRAGHMDYIGVMQFDEQGRAVYEERFLGLFTSSAYRYRPQDIPIVRDKCRYLIEQAGVRADSYSSKALRRILESLPRDELLQCNLQELQRLTQGLLVLNEHPELWVFSRPDRYLRFHVCLVYVPSELFNRQSRKRIEAILKTAYNGHDIETELALANASLTRLRVVIYTDAANPPQVDLSALQDQLHASLSNWHSLLRRQLIEQQGEGDGTTLANRFSQYLPATYVDKVTPNVAAEDVFLLDSLSDNRAIRMALYSKAKGSQTLRLKVYRQGESFALSDVLPQLENLGLRVLTEQVYDLALETGLISIQEFDVMPMQPLRVPVSVVGAAFEKVCEQVWQQTAESDNFNRLVLQALLDWRQVAMLRAYCKYLQQVGTSFSQPYMEDTLAQYPLVAYLLVQLFYARFDPQADNQQQLPAKVVQRDLTALANESALGVYPNLITDTKKAFGLARHPRIDAIQQIIAQLLNNVASLDDERIIKSYLDVINATLRSNYFQPKDGELPNSLSFKLDCHAVPDMPKPLPYREIWVCSPRVEGIHLRFGQVARGGLRWSDRREDFRTEVLGLVKAQMVKNTVIVPVGSKGGFYVKNAVDRSDRDAWLENGKACYREYIRGMLDITDNLDNDKVLPPTKVVRHDDDDTYLVVAADKGTASFSDMANGVARDYHYWLDDAFASGGSHGYDHKGMGITAKGGWESVKHHFFMQGHNVQQAAFSCVGIGDMSGDVFGNGLLRSKATRLIAAFDHRDIFVDPTPDAASSFAERQRLYNLPRSSWDDYNRERISAGGGVWSRQLKAVPVSSEMREALGIATTTDTLTPDEMIQAILKAPVDLLWNGGIGTYVKSTTETHADVGDRANENVRVNGADLRCHIVGEGGNLGFTQKGRVEAALNGVINNTDFIDNSAGVDTSDHEVNIKILLNDAVASGQISQEERNEKLASMADEVEQLVLQNNYRQNRALTLMKHTAGKRHGSLVHFIRTLEHEGKLDREIESLPSDVQLAERHRSGGTLTRPELAILLSYDKINVFNQLLESDVPEDDFLAKELVYYFPRPLHGAYAKNMARHPLKREIIATAVTNAVVNRMGATFVQRLREDSGQEVGAVVRAFAVARHIFSMRNTWDAIDQLEEAVEPATQMDAVLQAWRFTRQAIHWLLKHPDGKDISQRIDYFKPFVDQLWQALPSALTETGESDFALSTEKWQGLDVPDELAGKLVRYALLEDAFDMIEVALQTNYDVAVVAGVFFDLQDVFHLGALRRDIKSLPVDDRWHVQARGALLDDLARQTRMLAARVLAVAEKSDTRPVIAWLKHETTLLRQTHQLMAEVTAKQVDFPVASVAVSRLGLLAADG